jgi:hypothetical protein
MRTSAAVAFLLAILLTGCGGESSRSASTASSHLDPLKVGKHARQRNERSRIGDKLQREIERQDALSGSPRAPIPICRSYQGQYESTASARQRYGKRIARQLYTLCPDYFAPPG